MIPTVATKIRWLKMMNVQSCNSNCICADRIRRNLLKIPLNIIDEAFISFQLKEAKKEYDMCIKSKKENDSFKKN
tara:strand:+ start:1281 stop:1505 length:225 start_codon:yes stop_codon:yes gene_type:complete